MCPLCFHYAEPDRAPCSSSSAFLASAHTDTMRLLLVFALALCAAVARAQTAAPMPPLICASRPWSPVPSPKFRPMRPLTRIAARLQTRTRASRRRPLS